MFITQKGTLIISIFILPQNVGGGGGHLILCPPPEKTWGGGDASPRPPRICAPGDYSFNNQNNVISRRFTRTVQPPPLVSMSQKTENGSPPSSGYTVYRPLWVCPADCTSAQSLGPDRDAGIGVSLLVKICSMICRNKL